jgi:hypothetical protein
VSKVVGRGGCTGSYPGSKATSNGLKQGFLASKKGFSTFAVEEG